MVVLVAIGKNDGYAVLNDGEIKMVVAANGEREREKRRLLSFSGQRPNSRLEV
jgi:hypothetical protein